MSPDLFLQRFFSIMPENKNVKLLAIQKNFELRALFDSKNSDRVKSHTSIAGHLDFESNVQGSFRNGISGLCITS